MNAARTSWLYGPLSQLGYTLMVLTIALDQAHKWWMLLIYRIQDKGRVTVTPFLDLVYVKNTGVSYGMFLQDSREGQWLLAGFAVLAEPGDGRLAGQGRHGQAGGGEPRPDHGRGASAMPSIAC